MNKKLIVISAVNLIEAGTLAILRECLSYLSILASGDDFRVIAIVFKRDLVDFPNIEYVETQWPKKRWMNRLWYEYVSMNKISRKLGPVYLWFSLHDTSPTVQAERRAVYCHNSYFHYRWKFHDLIFAPKIALFAIFTKWIYRTNILKNNFLVVQQDWFRNEMHKMFGVSLSKIIVARPDSTAVLIPNQKQQLSKGFYSFLFAGSPNSHKNFEVICRAAEILEHEIGNDSFKVTLTVKGDENKYASWLYKKWGHLKTIDFKGFIKKEELFQLYGESDCLIFPSKIESWGLPISEFKQYSKPMLLADLPYAHETASGAEYVSFFDPNKPVLLADKMKKLISKDDTFLVNVPFRKIEEPMVCDWNSLFVKLLF